MKLQDFAPDATEVYTATLADRSIRSTRNVPIEIVMSKAYQIVETRTKDKLAAMITEVMTEMYEMFTLTNGERDDAPVSERDDWEERLDDEASSVLEPYAKMLSSNWMATMTIDCRLYEEGFLDRLADGFARECWSWLTTLKTDDPDNPFTQRTPNQVLSAIGVLKSTFEELLTAKPQISEAKEKEAKSMDIDTVLRKVLTHVGADVDVDDLTDNLDNASDDDDSLALGGAMAVGLEEDDIEVLRIYRLEHGDDAIAGLVERLSELSSEPGNDPTTLADESAELAAMMGAGDEIGITSELVHVGPEHVQVSDEDAELAAMMGTSSDKPDKPKRKGPTRNAASAPGAVPAEALKLLKQFTNVKSEDMGAGIGTSRATFDNYAKGKAVLVANAEQKQFFLKVIDEHIAGLTEARNLFGSVIA